MRAIFRWEYLYVCHIKTRLRFVHVHGTVDSSDEWVRGRGSVCVCVGGGGGIGVILPHNR